MVSQFTDTSEKAFQGLITHYLVNENGYVETYPNEYDREFCLNPKTLFAFLEATQPDVLAFIQKKGEKEFFRRLDEKLIKEGIIELLRKGLKFYDKTIKLMYARPASTFNEKAQKQYEQNIFSVTEELKYSLSNENRLDLTVFLNGLPLITMELKNAFTNQAVKNAIRQYQNDRDHKEKLFNMGRCIVHFAADTDLVYMSAHLKGKATDFLPFNKGLNNGGASEPFGAGNPLNKEGLKTDYLWKEILTKESLSNIVEKYAQIIVEKDDDTGKEKRKMIFPRYHQLTVVRQILTDVKKHGVGQRYLVQHSAGSGKSNSIAWLSHQLANLFDETGENNIFDSVIVVTDRTVLDKQLRDNIKQFAQTKGVVEAITGDGGSKKNHLRDALANNKKVIISTIQTFPHLLDEITELSQKRFAIIIDEAHSSQSGETAAKMNAALSDKSNLKSEEKDEQEPDEPTLEDKINELIESRRMIKNGSYFAFTATPKNKTLETFGVPQKRRDTDGVEKTKFFPFHVYSMKQAIEEEFILDVLSNYTTYNSYYKLVKSVENNPEFDTRQAQKKLRAYVEGHEFAISEKAKIMIDHFQSDVRSLINGEAKAMVVTKSILSAIKYKFAFDEYLKELNLPYKTIIAFSGKKTYKGNEYDENSMNAFADKMNDIPKQFKKSDFRFLIVANKYQTGFDQPLLHTMYVDKKLVDTHAVQTLSRLNRCYKPHKKDTFVLDFYNAAADIKEAFAPYYTSTILAEETNPNKLNDLEDSLANFDVYSEATVKDFFEKYSKNAPRTVIDPIIDSISKIFDDELTNEKKKDFKQQAKSFLRVYSYLSKILDFNNVYWEQLWWFLKLLVPKLNIDHSDDLAEGVLEAVAMDSYRPTKDTTQKIVLSGEIGEVAPIPVNVKGGLIGAEIDYLENIIKAFNDRFGKINWSDKDKVNAFLLTELPAKAREDAETLEAIQNSDRQNARLMSDKKVDELMRHFLKIQTEVYREYSNDSDFKRQYQEFMFNMLWEGRNSQGQETGQIAHSI